MSVPLGVPLGKLQPKSEVRWGLTLPERSEAEVRQVGSQFAITGCLLKLAIRLAGIKLGDWSRNREAAATAPPSSLHLHTVAKDTVISPRKSMASITASAASRMETSSSSPTVRGRARLNLFCTRATQHPYSQPPGGHRGPKGLQDSYLTG